MGWLALVLLTVSAAEPPGWATVHRLFDSGGFVLPPGGVSGGAAMSGQFSDYGPYALGRARLDVGLPVRLELGLFAETAVVPLSTRGTARVSLRWAPVAWGEVPVNPTVGLSCLATVLGKVFVGPRFGLMGTVVDARWRWAVDGSFVARPQTPSGFDYLVSSMWLAELHGQMSFQIVEPLSTGVYFSVRRAGPSPDGGKPWTSTLYPTTDGRLEAGLFLQLTAGPFTFQVSLGYRRIEVPEDPGVTIFSHSASLTFAVTAGAPWRPRNDSQK